MERSLTGSKTFARVNFTENPLPRGEYEDCVFDHCDLSRADLSGSRFTECVFRDCNLSSARLAQTVLRDVKFENSKLMGLHFDHCDHFLFSASFSHCNMRFCSFFQVKMKKTRFADCDLQETDFTETDLSWAIFENCDLDLARFENTLLEKADLRTARNYLIDPELNRIKKAKFSFPAVLGLLGKYDIEID
jgi:fluoroquinolone resistance protein